jgi:hypothetical protein
MGRQQNTEAELRRHRVVQVTPPPRERLSLGFLVREPDSRRRGCVGVCENDAAILGCMGDATEWYALSAHTRPARLVLVLLL